MSDDPYAGIAVPAGQSQPAPAPAAAPVAWPETPITSDQYRAMTSGANGLAPYAQTADQSLQWDNGGNRGPNAGQAYIRIDPQTGQAYLRSPPAASGGQGQSAQPSQAFAPPTQAAALPQTQDGADPYAGFSQPVVAPPPPAPNKVVVETLTPADFRGSDEAFAAKWARIQDEMKQQAAEPEGRMGWGEDIARSVLPNLANGFAHVLSAPSDVLNFAMNTPTWLLNQLTPNHQPYQSYNYTGDFWPTGDQIDGGVQALAGPNHLSQTTPGKFAGAIAGFAPNALLGGEGLVSKAVQTVVPAVASEAAGEAAANAHLDPKVQAAIRMGAALATGHVAGLPFGASGAEKALNTATAGMTPEQIAATQAVRQTGAGYGVTPTIPEAAQVATQNGAGVLAKLQQITEQNPASAPIMAAALGGRLDASKAAVNSALDKVAPAPPQPSVVGQQAQAAAKGVVSNLEGERTALTSPYYTAAAPQTVNPADMDTMLSSLDARIAADKTGIIAGPLSKFRDLITQKAPSAPAAGSPPSVRDQVEQAWAQATGAPAPGAAPQAPATSTPILDIGNLDRARKYIRDNAAASVGRGTMTPEQASAMTGFADQLDAMMEKASPAYVGGKANHAQFTTDHIDPVTAGPVGKMTGTDQVQGQTRALYPTAPLPGAAAETATAGSLLNAQQPDILAALTRLHLGQTAAEAMQDTRSGPNLYGPAGWAATIAGNPEQRATLMAGVTAGSGADAAAHLGGLLDTFGATGRRLPVSPDEADAAKWIKAGGAPDLVEGLIGAGVGHESFGGAGTFLAPAAKLGGMGLDAFNSWRANAGAKALAEALTVAPEDTAKIIGGAKAKADQSAAILRQMLANGLTAAQVGPSQQSQASK